MNLVIISNIFSFVNLVLVFFVKYCLLEFWSRIDKEKKYV